QRGVGEVERCAPLILGERNVDARSTTRLEVELRVCVEGLVVAAVHTDREYVGDPVVQAQARGIVRDELVVEGEPPEGLQLQAILPQHEDLLNGEQRFFDVTSGFLVEVQGGARL